MTTQKTIRVKVDKSHLLTLGEKMYVESIEMIRELANNGYDADATKVFIKVSPEEISVEDDGNGMGPKGLEQFFTVGSEEKKIHNVSPRFGRKRIGQFGIGKFAALAAGNQFKIESRKGKRMYGIVFDRDEWQKGEGWELPISRRLATALDPKGTKVILSKIKKKFNLAEIERYLKETIPLRAKKFSVYLNGKLITPRFIPGRTIPINVQTLYGRIDGEIIIAVDPKLVDAPGLECRVKQVLIKRELFGLESKYQSNIARVTGWVNVDFLPITASRNNFIRDSSEYKLFEQIIKGILERVLVQLKQEYEKRNLKRISHELRTVLDQIRHALILNPELSPSGKMIAKLKKGKGSFPMAAAVPKIETEKEIKEKTEAEKLAAKAISQEIKEKPKIQKPAVLKRIQVKKLGISCGIVSLGEDGPEVFSQGNMVYINQDHKIYRKLYPKKDLFHIHLLRLITQEVVMMKKFRLPAREAFDLQSRLLKSALSEI